MTPEERRDGTGEAGEAETESTTVGAGVTYDAEGLPHGFLAELATAESAMERLYRESRAPDSDLEWAITRLWTVGDLLLFPLWEEGEPPPPPVPRAVRAAATRALHLSTNLELWRSSLHLQGLLSEQSPQDTEAAIREELRPWYGQLDATKLSRTIDILRRFGGAATTGTTPLNTLAAKLGKPRKPERVTNRSAGKELRRLLKLPQDDPDRRHLETCLEKLTAEEQKFIRTAYGSSRSADQGGEALVNGVDSALGVAVGPVSGYATLQGMHWSGRKITKVKELALKHLADCVPSLQDLVLRKGPRPEEP